MARYDVHRNPNPRSREHTPYLVDVQADALSGLNSRVVVPLMEVGDGPRSPRTLYPTFAVEGRSSVMVTPLVAGLGLAAIGDRVAGLQDHGATILAALDLVLTGA